MAVTNRARDAVKSPAWAVRGKMRLAHVPGGPADAARAVLSGQWDRSPAGLTLAARYTPALVDELVEKRINTVCLTWSAGFSHRGDQPQWDAVRKLLPLLKKKKIRTIARLSLTACFADEFFAAVPEAQRWLQTDRGGQPIRNDEEGHWLLFDVRKADWQKYLHEKMNFALDAGCDGIYFDDVFGPPAETATLLQTLAAAGHEKARCGAADFLFYSNSYGVCPSHDEDGIKFSEDAQRPGLSDEGARQTNLAQLKYLYEEGGRDRVFCYGSWQTHQAIDSGAGFDVLRLSVAEILAGGGLFHGFNAPRAYQNFLADNAALFGPADPVNTIGILASDVPAPLDDFLRHDQPLGYLIRQNLQFDIIPVRCLKRFDLRKYQLLSALAMHSASDAVLEELHGFVHEGGGTLLVSPQTASTDEHGAERSGNPLLAIPKEKRSERVLGKGRIVAYNYSADDEVDPIRRTLLKDLQIFGGPQPLQVSAPDGVVAVLWGKGVKRWVHVLNFRSEHSTATITLPGCGGRQLKIYSPDETAPAMNVLETGQANASFSLAGIHTYAIVEVS